VRSVKRRWINRLGHDVTALEGLPQRNGVGDENEPAKPPASPPASNNSPAARPIATPEDNAHVLSVVKASGSSFYGAMRTLPPLRRDAMYAIYAFCREIDDIADDPLPPAEKVAGLAEWRTEIDRLFQGKPGKPIGRALLEPIDRFKLRKQDFIALIDGMEMDANESLRGPSMETLELYCARVAGAVGMLSVRVFGAHQARADDVAWSLGQALQLTNILRDIAEDAERGRLYLPDELLSENGIASRDPIAVLKHPALPRVCNALAELAEKRFREAIAAMADCDRHQMRPAVVMMHVYHRILQKLRSRGWQRLDQPVRVSKLTKIWIALRYGYF
jgi:phytoene synthase